MVLLCVTAVPVRWGYFGVAVVLLDVCQVCCSVAAAVLLCCFCDVICGFAVVLCVIVVLAGVSGVLLLWLSGDVAVVVFIVCGVCLCGDIVALLWCYVCVFVALRGCWTHATKSTKSTKS